MVVSHCSLQLNTVSCFPASEMTISRALLSSKSGLICVVVLYVFCVLYLVNYFHITPVNKRLVPNSTIFYRTQKPAPRNISLMPSRLSSVSNALYNGLHRQSIIVVQDNGSSGSDDLLTGNNWNNKQVRGEDVRLNALNGQLLTNY